ncbi:hypothetical protein GNI_159660 [Gregarina niphandrodes]|uniref:Uncharacterized protein n=1 Tax=Gregarina niphandrodes TaxID=110365 RepID=A0A023AYQ4_GRENI|nr:hypothetical protein GNI_159660 [Gregarina niphandrodes]EZG43769.1 hypothetical protein GNI_159660 [Gregarina niphandrodes]|eukprot:XP_011134617.1 hypothetical protein GNI_159660 [Gregarina niphandrodes]
MVVDDSPFWDVAEVDWTPYLRLLRIPANAVPSTSRPTAGRTTTGAGAIGGGGTTTGGVGTTTGGGGTTSGSGTLGRPELLDRQDVLEIVQAIASANPRVDKNWINDICHTLAQTRTMQQQVVCLGRTLQSLFEKSRLAFLDAFCAKVGLIDGQDPFELELHALDVNEKTAIIIQNEQRLLHTATLCEQLQLMTASEGLIDAVRRNDLDLARLATIERRATQVLAQLTLFEDRLFELVKHVAKVNQLFTMTEQIQTADD